MTRQKNEQQKARKVSKLYQEKTGRTVRLTDGFTDFFCREIVSGKPISKICGKPGMPSESTIRNWLAQKTKDGDYKNLHFRESYFAARQEAAHKWIDESVEIADEPSGDVTKDKLRIDTRFRAARAVNPTNYGERSQVNVQHAGKVDVEVDPREAARAILSLMMMGAKREDLGLPMIEEKANVVVGAGDIDPDDDT